MDVIARWTIWACPQCGATPRPFDCNHDRPPMPHGRHEMVKVEVVRADQLAGAVEALRRIIETYDGGAVTRPDFYRAIDEARKLTNLGGQ